MAPLIVVGIAGLGCGTPQPQSDACHIALECYFHDDPGPFQGLGFDHAAIERAYGSAGSCWGDIDLAKICDARCLELIREDCSTDGTCAEGCAHLAGHP